MGQSNYKFPPGLTTDNGYEVWEKETHGDVLLSLTKRNKFQLFS